MTPLVRATRDTWRLCCALRKHMERNPEATMLDVLRAACEGGLVEVGCGSAKGVGVRPYYEDPAVTVYEADALDLLRFLPDASVQLRIVVWGGRP